MIELVRASLADVGFARELFELTANAASFATELVLDDAEIVVVTGERTGWVQSSVHGNAIHLAQLHIAPAWRGRGIGRAVVDRVIERAHAARRDVTLAVQAASPARRLYERLGFELDLTALPFGSAAGRAQVPTSELTSVPAGDTIYLRRQLTSP